MDHKTTLTTPDKIQIVGILSKAKKDNDKIIVLCHGLTVDKDEGGIFRQLSENLVENGFDCFRFDFRGHGESGGKQEEMTIAGELTDLLTVVNFIKSQINHYQRRRTWLSR
jgi:predicted alpha/beta-fold hydrolase